MRNNDCYHIISIEEGIKKLEENDNGSVLNFIYQDPRSGLRGYSLSRGEYLFLPGNFDKRNFGILVKNRNCFDLIIREEFSMFSNPEYARSPLENFRDDFLELNQSQSRLAGLLFPDSPTFDIDIISKDVLERKYDHLRELINTGSTTDIDGLIVSYLVLFGMYYNEKTQSKWALWIYAGLYSKYYEPVILSRDGAVRYIYNHLGNSLSSSLSFDFFYKNFEHFKFDNKSMISLLHLLD